MNTVQSAEPILVQHQRHDIPISCGHTVNRLLCLPPLAFTSPTTWRLHRDRLLVPNELLNTLLTDRALGSPLALQKGFVKARRTKWMPARSGDTLRRFARVV